MSNSLLEHLRQYIKRTKKDWNYITPQQFYELHNKPGQKDYILIDLRKASEFKKGHIKGARNIFWCDILDEKNLAKLPKNKTIYLVCYVGHTASQVMTMLKLLGYKAVTIKYGMGISPVMGVPVAGWYSYNYPVTKSICHSK